MSPLRSLSLTLAAALLLIGCASPTHRAPVEERALKAPRAAVVANAPTPAAPVIVAPAVPVAPPVTPPVTGAIALPVSPSGPVTEPAPSKPPPGIENLGKPGYYAVKPGDTMIRIGLESGQNWRDIVRWNNLENANVIEVGQVLRVVPPVGESANTLVRPASPVPGAAVGVAGSSAPPAAPSMRPSNAASTPQGSAVSTPPSPAVAAPTAPAAAAGASSGDDDLNWTWPAAGPVLSGFDEARSKGLAIGGRAGDPVLAAADGRVVYAGSGLRGYGNLVIVKHNNTFLTAYAHNQTLLVKEDQNVRRGQRIAEMGSTDADRVQLHFEIRRQGRPVDPARLLPAR